MITRFRRSSAAVVITLGIMAVMQPVRAAVPGTNGRLAVLRTVTGTGWVVTTMEADGSDHRRVYLLGGFRDSLYDIDWSPDASRLAVNPCCGRTIPYSIVSIAADGSDHQDLVRKGQHPAWSPDGTRIAYERYGSNGGFSSWIYIADADGSNASRFTGLHSRKAFYPAWSPDGASIAFTRSDSEELVIKPIGGGAPTVIKLPKDLVYADHLEWAPDGSAISFAGYTCFGDCADIWSMDVTSRAFTRLTRTPVAIEADADWSPDGSTIVYVRWDDFGFESSDLWFMDADGTDKRSIETNRQEFAVDWATA